MGAVLGVLLVATGCDPETVDLETESVEPRRGSGGGGCGGGTWIGNGLVDPDVSDVDPAHGLDTNAGLDLALDSMQVATYLVECALPEGDVLTKSLQGQTVELHGAVGLAPEWKHGSCDGDCQEWVSACLLARVNVSGESVGLWLAADHPAIGLGHGGGGLFYEATFYGNLFQSPEALSLCRGTQEGEIGGYLDDRTCDGQPLEECGFTDWGDCGAGNRCLSVNGFATECATGGDPAAGVRYHSISTFVSIEGWQGG